MPRFLKSIFAFFYNRRLQVDILTVFLILIAMSCLFIITFNYAKNYKAILQHAKGTIRRTTTILNEKLNCVVSDMEQLAQAGSGLFLNRGDFSLENKELVSYMLEVIRYYPEVYSFYIGTETGKFLAAGNVSSTDQTHYFSDPSKPLPAGTRYSLDYIDKTGKRPVEIYEYLNENLEILGKEEIPNEYDPQTRPWYLGAKTSRTLYWTDEYIFQPENVLGITVAKPIFNASGDIISVVGVDLTLNMLSNFLGKQKIGKTGKVYILNFSGDVIIDPNTSDPSTVNKETVSAVFDRFVAKHENDFMLKYNGVEYLASITPFPAAFSHPWYIAVIVPFLDYFEDMLETEHYVFIISLFILIVSGVLVAFFSKRISRPIVQLAGEIDKIKNFNFEGEVKIPSYIYEINVMTDSINALKSAIRSFSKFVPKELVDKLIQKGDTIAFEGEKKEISIFFLEIMNYSAISQKLSIDKQMVLLSEYFEGISKIIVDTQGIIDKYMGEKIMAFWGAPLDVPDHAEKACLAALKCRYFDILFNKHRLEKGGPEFHSRMGLHEGKVIVGNIRTQERMNYSVLGDSLDIAARLEALSSVFHSSIIISDEIRQKIGDKFLVRPLDHLLIKGKKEKIKIYELMAIREGEHSIKVTSAQIELSSLFTQAYELYHSGKIPEAKAAFEALRQKFPDDYPTQIYLQRCQSGK